MSIENKRLFILPFPQRLLFGEENKLICNVVVLPRNNPFDDLVDGDDLTAFASATFRLKAWLVKGGSDKLPTDEDHSADAAYQQRNNLILQNNSREAVFHAIEKEFTIDLAPVSLSGKPPVLLKKYLPEAYRNAFGFSQPRNDNAVTDESYFCSLKNSSFSTPYVRNDKVNWGQVLAFSLSQRLLAEALGIVYTGIEISLGDAEDGADFFKEGGWVYFDFDETNAADTTLSLPNSELVQCYAARIPAATTSRQVFAPVLFPVLHVNAGGVAEAAVPFDDVFKDAVLYDDGFAKIVHGSQAVNTNPILETKEGPLPLMDTGIRLGWDDEQILTWLSRSYKDTHLGAAAATQKAHSKFAVSRYRIDVAEISKPAFDSADMSLTEGEVEGKWRSQVAMASKKDLQIGDVDLGSFTGESGVQVSPARSSDKGPLWLPAFFAFWNGASLAVPDPIPEEINNLAPYKEKQAAEEDRNAPILYEQPANTIVDLTYGNHYAFRVRLSDISGGGPTVEDNAIIRGENGICKHKFTRNVAPSPSTVTDEDGGLKIVRPRLGYPAILFAVTPDKKKKAIDLLKEDRKALDTASAALAEVVVGEDGKKKYAVKDPSNFDLFQQASREVSIADPDVDKVHIIVEAVTLDMDREASYNAVNKVTPKEPYILLYETFRRFPDYALSLDEEDHTLHLPYGFRDVPVILFNEGRDAAAIGLGDDVNNENGPLILPTGRKLRITIRSCRSRDETDYFGHDDFRFSTPVKREARKNIEALEAIPLLQATSDPLVSLFFRPEAVKIPQEFRAAAASGNQNQVDVNIVERLSSICGFNKNGLSLLGKENERIQFGCSNLIGHTLSPDHSSVTFATMDDLSRKWISVIQLQLSRDWSWDMLEADSFEVFRQWRFLRDDGIGFEDGVEEKIGVIGLTKGLNWQNMPGPDRSKTRLVFIDALLAKPGAKPVSALQEASKFPEPVVVRYRITPHLMDGINFDAAAYQYTTQSYDLQNELPITDPPAQVPEIVSVGLAMSAFDTDERLFNNQYSATSEQLKYLWIEFAEPVENPFDAYCARLLAYAPDPALAGHHIDVQKEMEEPAINLDPEIIRMVRPLQVHDNAGIDAMPQLVPATADADPAGKDARHFLLPLPEGLNADSPELFGFFTYEFAVGHTAEKWSSAQGRYGRKLPVTGVQHPAPRLRVSAIRKTDTIEVSATFAESYFKGNNCTPLLPKTNIYALLYAQVLQADGKQYRNVLIDQVALRKFSRNTNVDKPIGSASWVLKEVRTKLNAKGMDINAPLSILAIETMPDSRRGDIPGNAIDLENTRILRTSRLYKIEESCPV